MSGAVAAVSTYFAADAVAATAADAVATAGAETAATIGADGLTTVAASSALPSLSTIASGASLASAGISGVGSILSGQAQDAAAGYNAAVARNNAQIATQNANVAGAVGEQSAGIQGLKNRAAIGGVLAAQGANGVDVGSGSAVSVRAGQQEAGQLSAQQIRSNAARQAYGFQTQAASDTGQATEDMFTGKQAALAGDIGAGSDLVKGVGNASQLLGGNPPTPAQAYAAQQASSGSILPVEEPLTAMGDWNG